MAKSEPSEISFRQRLLGALPSMRPDVATSVWLLHLRWFAVVGQLVTISAAGFYFVQQLPVQTLLVLVGFTAATNVVYAVWLRGETAESVFQSNRLDQESFDQELADSLYVPPVAGVGYSATIKMRVAAGLMLLDLVTLTAMLHFSGGVDNPFAAFFFVNLAVAGVMLQPRWAWVLTVIAVLAFATLLFSYVPLKFLSENDPTGALGVQHLGAFIAFSTCASVVTYFVTSTAEELTRRERELRLTQAEQARGRQRESLSTLAAGAAHELATPMSTVLLVARELQHHLEDIAVPESVRRDLQLIDSELRHCRAILARMRSAAGDHASEQWQQTTVGELLDTVLEGIREPHRVDISPETDRVEDHTLWLPSEAVAQAIRNLIHNGLDASPESTSVLVDLSIESNWLLVRTQDWGEGMPEDVLDRIGQPFFTTKEPGRGMGLGLFLSGNVIRRLGGTLEFSSQPGKGTTALVRLPCSKLN
jgi:two-component system, sensor histidine kinase RegB